MENSYELLLALTVCLANDIKNKTKTKEKFPKYDFIKSIERSDPPKPFTIQDHHEQDPSGSFEQVKTDPMPLPLSMTWKYKPAAANWDSRNKAEVKTILKLRDLKHQIIMASECDDISTSSCCTLSLFSWIVRHT